MGDGAKTLCIYLVSNINSPSAAPPYLGATMAYLCATQAFLCPSPAYLGDAPAYLW